MISERYEKGPSCSPPAGWPRLRSLDRRSFGRVWFGGGWGVLAPDAPGAPGGALHRARGMILGEAADHLAAELRKIFGLSARHRNFGRRARACRPSVPRRVRCRFADSATTSEFGREQHQPPPTSTAHDRSPPPAFRAEGSSVRTQPRPGQCAACRGFATPPGSIKAS